MTKITLEGEYQTRDGRPVRVLCVDRKGKYPVVALVEEKCSGDEAMFNYREDGKFYSCLGDSALDLIPVPKRHKRTVWVNVYPERAGAHMTRKLADDYADEYRIACLKLDLDFAEGEGL